MQKQVSIDFDKLRDSFLVRENDQLNIKVADLSNELRDLKLKLKEYHKLSRKTKNK